MGKKMISELSAIHRPILAVPILLLAASHMPAAQRPQNRAPVPLGQDIVARDGDRVIVEEDARVQIVRRRAATVRAIFDQPQRMLTVLIDYPPRPGEMPDGGVDSMMTYFDVEGDWPLGERWEGSTTIEEYTIELGRFGSGFGLTTPGGVVQLLPGAVAGAGSLEPHQRHPATIAVLSYQGFGGGGGHVPPISFDQAEQEQLAQAASQAASRGLGGGANGPLSGSGGAGGFSTWATSTSGPVQGGGMNVGGGMRAARKKSGMSRLSTRTKRATRMFTAWSFWKLPWAWTVRSRTRACCAASRCWTPPRSMPLVSGTISRCC